MNIINRVQKARHTYCAVSVMPPKFLFVGEVELGELTTTGFLDYDKRLDSYWAAGLEVVAVRRTSFLHVSGAFQ